MNILKSALYATFLISSLINAGAVSAAILYSNGTVVEADATLRFNSDDHVVYDDFNLNVDSVITGFEWSQFDEQVDYIGTVLTLFNGLPAPSSHIATFVVVATRTSNGLAVNTVHLGGAEVFGFNYLADDLSMSLPAGRYYLGVWNDIVDPGANHTLIATTNGTPDTALGYYQQNDFRTPPLFGLTEAGPNQFESANIAFQVHGNVSPVSQPVAIDIRPFGKKNKIRPNSRGFIPVSILGSGNFDALQTIVSTVRFGPDGAKAIRWLVFAHDINRDGFSDLTLFFKTRKTGIQCGDTDATLTGSTYPGETGDTFSGTDSITTVRCP